MDMFDLASTLFGNRRDPVAQGSSLTATGSAASEDGTAYLVMDADVTPAEGVGDDTDQTVIDVPTSPSVAEGDEVIMTLVGDGPLKTPVVMANPGFGDRVQTQVDSAETLAQQAEAVAQEASAEVEQVRQDVADFRDDVATTYATKVERQDGDDAVKTWVTTNYTNSNDLSTTYATKTLVSQTRDAIELAASQTYETQSDAAATYATKSALTVGLDGIRSEVAEDYQPKGDYATTASMNSAIQQSASSIESSVAATYTTKAEFEGLQVGGTNLAKGTSATTEMSGTLSSTGAVHLDLHTYTITRIEGATEYVVSFEAYASAACTVLCFWYSPNTTTKASSSTGQSGTGSDGRCEVTLTTGWKRYWVKWTQSDSVATDKKLIMCRIPRPSSGSLTVHVRAVKMETGTVPTDWSPAPEDIAATYATKTEVQQTASGLDTRITTAQSTADGAYLERSATGTTIDTTGAATIRSLVVDGRSVQDGTPSPSAPVPIVSVGPRNLLDAWLSAPVTSAGVTYTNGADGSVVLNGTKNGGSYTIIKSGLSLLLPAGTYRFNAQLVSGTATNTPTIYLLDTSSTAITSVSPNTSGALASATVTVSEPKTVAILRFALWTDGSVYTGATYQIWLEYGTTAHDYQPHGCVTLVAGNTRTDIDLQGHALRSLPNGTRDGLRVEGGNAVLAKRVGMLDTSLLTQYAANNGFIAYKYMQLDAGSTSFRSNLFDKSELFSSSNMTKECMQFSTNGQIFVALSDTRPKSDFVLLYKLATPQTIDLGTIDLPAPADTLWLDAAIVPTIGATWWTVGGIAGQQALDAEVTERQTLIRQFSGGVLAGYVGNAIAALVNAAGSFDVVQTAWSNGVPSILGTLARYAASGISLFDAAGNVLAEFASDHVRIGGAIPEDGSAVATVRFFDSDADKGAMLTGYVDQSGDATQQTQDTRTQLRTRTHDADMPTTYGAAGESGLEVGQWLHAETGSYSTVESTATLTATADSGTDPTQTAHASASLGVKAVTVNDSAEEAYLTVNGNDVPMEQVLAAFPVTLYDNASASASASATLSETAANFSRLTILFKDNDGNHASADVWQPDGKRAALAITWISGASTQEMYQRVRWVSISGTTISTYKASSDAKYRTGQVKLGATASVTNGDYISIVHVIGWR